MCYNIHMENEVKTYEWKKLIYGNIEYNNFYINKQGDIKNSKTNKIYKPYINPKGYAIVTLPMGKRGEVKTIRLHKALAETFIPNPNNYEVVHHKDENTSNYDLANLEWTTHRLNTTYHLKELAKGTELFNNRKLTQNDVEFIRQNHYTMSRRELAVLFGVSKTTITNVVNNKLYANGVW